MIKLRNFTHDDCEFIVRNFYPNMTHDDGNKMIYEWNTLNYKGSYFEMFAIIAENKIVGSVSIYDHGNATIGAGPTILEKHRKHGYAYQALDLVLQDAYQKGYTKTAAQIRKDNIASIKLHEKSRFILVGDCITSRSNSAFLFEKSLS